MVRLFALLLAVMLSACVIAAPSGDNRIALTFDDIPRDRGAWLDDEERTKRLIAGF